METSREVKVPFVARRPTPTSVRYRWAWFALNEDAPVAFFAGLWTPWHVVRRKDDTATCAGKASN